MRPTIVELGIDRLSKYDRMGLIEQLWASLPGCKELRDRDEREGRTEPRPPYLPYKPSAPDFVYLADFGLDNLSDAERIEYADEIGQAIATDGGMPLTRAQKAELARRLSEAEANPDDFLTAEEVWERISRRVRP